MTPAIKRTIGGQIGKLASMRLTPKLVKKLRALFFAEAWVEMKKRIGGWLTKYYEIESPPREKARIANCLLTIDKEIVLE